MLLLWQPTTHLFYLSAVSVQEILCPRCILAHKIGGFRASECLSQEYFIMQIMNIKIKKLLLTLQKQTIRCMQSKKIVCFPPKINERKKHWCWTINIYTTHKIEPEFYYRNFQSGFFPLNVELNTETKKNINDEIELFYYFLVCGAVYIYTEKTSRSSTYERPRCW